MQHPTTHKLVRAVTAGLAAALLTVPAAHARLAVDARHAALLDKDVAGIGAAASLGLVFLAGAGVLVTRRRLVSV
jgi:hypothetical protein